MAATEAEGHDGVRVMTIHNAKGLEFEVVAVPSLDRRLLAGTPPALMLGPPGEEPRAVGLRLARLGGESLRLFDFDRIKERTEALDSEEERRLFYVAVTRARQRLILSGIRPERPPGPAAGTPVLSRLLASPGFGELKDGDCVRLAAPGPRPGLRETYPDADLTVRVSAPSAEQAAALVASASSPDPASERGRREAADPAAGRPAGVDSAPLLLGPLRA